VSRCVQLEQLAVGAATAAVPRMCTQVQESISGGCCSCCYQHWCHAQKIDPFKEVCLVCAEVGRQWVFLVGCAVICSVERTAKTAPQKDAWAMQIHTEKEPAQAFVPCLLLLYKGQACMETPGRNCCARRRSGHVWQLLHGPVSH